MVASANRLSHGTRSLEVGRLRAGSVFTDTRALGEHLWDSPPLLTVTTWLQQPQVSNAQSTQSQKKGSGYENVQLVGVSKEESCQGSSCSVQPPETPESLFMTNRVAGSVWTHPRRRKQWGWEAASQFCG